MTSNFLRTDVTAVLLFKKYILAGIGSELNIFERESFKLILKLNTLKSQKIYGIITSKCESKILIYGGKQLSVMSVARIEDGQATCTSPVICDDWLHSSAWVDETEVAVLTAHNVVQVWDTENWSLKSKNESEYNSILYSGLLVVLNDDILLLSGTVYSEVIIWTVKLGPLQFLKGHNGVIFSITYDPVKEIIVTTSDDRSVRFWKIENNSSFDNKLISYWHDVKIECIHELYGHTARIMRSHISDECIISVGEDSGICFWGFNGALLRRITSHQNSSIWSLHADDNHLVTGGGDSAIILHPLRLKDDYENSEIIDINTDTPKKLEFTARRNIVMVNESNDLVYYDLSCKEPTKHELNHDSTYKMLGISSCKQIIAVSDMKGNLDVFIENCKGEAEIHKIISTKLNIGKVLSMHWAGNRHLMFCSDSGIISIVVAKENDIETISSYVLPPCKERWLTAAAMSIDKKMIIVGDRCGNIHVYNDGVKNAMKTFNKVHGRYGATSINIKDNEMTTTGRDGSIKYFSINNDEVKFMSCKNVDFQWVEKFIDKNDKYICGFQERIFVVYSLDNNTKMIEANCGGGHRSWDVVRFVDKINDCYEEVIKVVYVKNSDIHLHTFLINRIISQNVIHGTHSNAINCLKTIKHKKDDKTSFFVSGGEDTILRISKLNGDGNFKDDFIFKHLSSIRTVKISNINNSRILLLSAGGRAQICAKILDIKENKIIAEEIIDFLIKGTDKDRKGNQNWKSVTVDFDPETRVMDLEVVKAYKGFKIFAACSDAYLRVFHLNDENKLVLVNNIKHHNTCILKTHSFNINNLDIVITCTTTGDVTFWNASDNNIIFSTKTNKSGINCISSSIISEDRFVIATGGDDNSIHVILLELNSSIKTIAKWTSCEYHSSQITGVIFVDDMLISTSIDQRLTLLKWSTSEDKIKCDFLSQSFSNVADIHGIDLLEYTKDAVTVCVFGKGVEVISIPVIRS